LKNDEYFHRLYEAPFEQPIGFKHFDKVPSSTFDLKPLSLKGHKLMS
jgi:hypothetical protein